MLKHRKKKELTCCGYALSCYKNKDKAKEKFIKYSKTSRNFWKSVGNSICEGILIKEDGKINEEKYKPHFALFEFIECDLSRSFKVIEKLI